MYKREQVAFGGLLTLPKDSADQKRRVWESSRLATEGP